MDANERFWLQKCIDSFRNNDFDALLKNSNELEKYAQDPSIPLMYEAIAYYHKKNFNKAKKIFYALYLKKFVKEKKQDTNLIYYLALCDLYSGNLDSAVENLRKLKRKEPSNTDYSIMLYLALSIKGDVSSSTMQLAEALGINSKKTVQTLEEMLGIALQNSKLSGTAKVLIIELVRKLSFSNKTLKN